MTHSGGIRGASWLVKGVDSVPGISYGTRMASKPNKATQQIGIKLNPTEAKVAHAVARKLGLNVQNAIRYLLKREHDAQTGGQNA